MRNKTTHTAAGSVALRCGCCAAAVLCCAVLCCAYLGEGVGLLGAHKVYHRINTCACHGVWHIMGPQSAQNNPLGDGWMAYETPLPECLPECLPAAATLQPPGHATSGGEWAATRALLRWRTPSGVRLDLLRGGHVLRVVPDAAGGGLCDSMCVCVYPHAPRSTRTPHTLSRMRCAVRNTAPSQCCSECSAAAPQVRRSHRLSARGAAGVTQ